MGPRGLAQGLALGTWGAWVSTLPRESWGSCQPRLRSRHKEEARAWHWATCGGPLRQPSILEHEALPYPWVVPSFRLSGTGVHLIRAHSLSGQPGLPRLHPIHVHPQGPEIRPAQPSPAPALGPPREAQPDKGPVWAQLVRPHFWRPGAQGNGALGPRESVAVGKPELIKSAAGATEADCAARGC